MESNANFLTKNVLFWESYFSYQIYYLCYHVMNLLFLSGLINISNFSILIISKAVFIDIAHIDKSSRGPQ